MNKLFTLLFLFNTSYILNAQSIIKLIEGNLYTIVSKKNTKLDIKLNTKIDNNTKYYFLNKDDFIIVENESDTYLLKFKDYPNGFKISELFSQKKEKNKFKNKLLNYFFKVNNDDNEINIDGLYMTDLHGITRSIFLNKKNHNIIDSADALFNIGRNSDFKIVQNESIIFQSKDSSMVLVPKNTIKNCKKCQILVNNNFLAELSSKRTDTSFIDGTDISVYDKTEKKIVQYLYIKYLIEREFYANANYLIYNHLKENSLIDEFTKSNKLKN